MKEKTKNGVAYTDSIASCDGASFILFPEPHHTEEMIKGAIAEIFRERDVVSLHVATENDWDEDFISEIFRHPHTHKLRWYEINADRQLINDERRKGTTVHDYIQTHVLPMVEQTRARMQQQYGDKIFDL